MSIIDEMPLDDGLSALERGESVMSVSEPSSRRQLEAPRPQVLTLATGGEEKPSPFSVARVLAAALHRFWLAVPLGAVLATIAVGALWYFGEDRYRTSAWLHIRDQPEYIAFPTYDRSRSFGNTQVELLRSPLIVGRAMENAETRTLPEIKEIEGKEDLVAWVKKHLTVKPIGRSDLYEVSMETREPETASTIVMAIVDAFMASHADRVDQQFERMRELLGEELKLRRRDTELKWDRLRSLNREVAGRTTGVVESVTGQAVSGGMAVLGFFLERMIDAEVEAEVLKAKIAAYRETMNRSVKISEQELADLVERDPTILAWKDELLSATESLKSFSSLPSAPRKILETKARDLERKIEERRHQLLPQLEQLTHEQIGRRREGDLKSLEDELASQLGLMNHFREKIAEQQVEQQEEGELTLDLDVAQKDYATAREIQEKIEMRLASMSTEARAPSRIEVWQPAKTPDFPEGSSLIKKMMALGLVAFCLPLGLLTGYELMVKRIYDRNQLIQETGIDYVGEVSALPVRRRLRSDRVFDRQAYILEESVDSVRTALAVTDRQDANKVVVVCSAVSGEGKTNFSAQLALSWSRGHEGPVLLIDADMRSPGMNEMFDIDLQPGLVEVLRGSATLQEAIVTDWGEGIHLLPAGKLGTFHPDRLIASQRFARLVEVARGHYSRIIIDVPPILSAHETLLLAKMSDGAILCALKDYSRSKQVQDAHQRLTRAGVNVLGAVLNGTSTRSYVYCYGSYYH